MSPRPSPCDGHSGNLPAYVDHELPDLEGAALEQHLDACGRCQARLRELEAVSSVLKGWDATSLAAPPAPARLTRTVLARVEAASQARRHARARRRVGSFALAASVLVALGAPLALALRERAAQVPPAPFERSIAAAPAQVATPPSAAPVVGPLPTELLAHQPWRSTHPGAGVLPASDPLTSDPAAREAFITGALDAQRALELERDFERRVGQRGIWVTDQKDGVMRRLLVTPEAARAFAADDLLAWLRAKSTESGWVPAQAPERNLALVPGDLLREHLVGLPVTPVLYTLLKPGAARTPVLEVRPLSARAEGPGLEGPEVLDALLAQERGQLSLEPAPHDVAVLNAVVRGTERPILLPAGQLIGGGVTDLVVARSTWLPASTGQQVWQIPCVVVRSGPRRSEAAARLLPFVAGPSVRALLLAEVEPEALRTTLRQQVGAALGGVAPAEWSLLDLYDVATDGQQVGQLAAVAAGAPAGVLASDGTGRFVGLEHVNVRGEGATPLLARLLHGYVWEAQRRARSRTPAATAGPSWADVVEGLRTAREPLVERPAPAGMAAPDVSRSTQIQDGRAAEALRVDGRRVVVSVLAR